MIGADIDERRRAVMRPTGNDRSRRGIAGAWVDSLDHECVRQRHDRSVADLQRFEEARDHVVGSDGRHEFDQRASVEMGA